MDNDIDNLKRSAAPNSERIATAVEESKDLLERICDYKEQQKQGDIRFRKGSTAASMFSIGISLTALYISITGLDGTGVRFFISLFEGLL